jgi:hypothetical protein
MGLARVFQICTLGIFAFQGNHLTIKEDLVELTYDRALHFLGELGRS